MKIAIGSDKSGFSLKEAIVADLLANKDEFGIEVKVKREPRTPIWVLAARQASIEAMRLEAVIISIEKAEFNAIVR